MQEPLKQEFRLIYLFLGHNLFLHFSDAVRGADGLHADGRKKIGYGEPGKSGGSGDSCLGLTPAVEEVLAAGEHVGAKGR